MMGWAPGLVKTTTALCPAAFPVRRRGHMQCNLSGAVWPNKGSRKRGPAHVCVCMYFVLWVPSETERVRCFSAAWRLTWRDWGRVSSWAAQQSISKPPPQKRSRTQR